MPKARKARRPRRSTPVEARWRRWLPPVCVGAAALALFALTLAPTVTAEDSGELIAAAWHFGIPHPPGYPLWTILCGLFTHMVPIGSVALRANLFSAVCSSAAAVVAYAAVREIRVSKPVAAAGALIWIWSRWSWSQSVITEVYALNSLLAAAVLWCGLRWSNTGSNRTLVAASLLLGLGMSNHHIIGFAGLAVAVWILVQRPRLLLRWKLALVCVGMFLVGLLPYVYLPLRSASDPPINWGDPSNPQRFLEHVTRHQYGAIGPQKVEEPRSLPRLTRQLRYLAASIADDMTPWLAGGAVAGMLLMMRRQRRLLLLVGLWLSSTGVLFAVLANYGFDVVSNWATRVFFIPVSLGLVIPLSYGLQWVIDLACGKLKLAPRRAALVTFVFALIGPIVQIAGHWRQCNYSNYWYAYDHGRNLLNCMMTDAMVFPSGDHCAFPLVYLVMVEGQRPDVLIADIYGYVRPDLLRNRPTNSPDDPVAWLIKHARRPVYFERKQKPPVDRAHFVPAGMLYHLLPSDMAFDDTGLFQNCAYRNWEKPTVQDSGARYILCDYEFFAGLDALGSGRTGSALEHFRSAVAIQTGVKELFNNIGSALAEHGLGREAVDYFRQAAEFDPRYATPRWNLVRLFRQLQRPEDAQRQLEKITQITPDDFRAFRELGFLLADNPDHSDRAIRYWRESLKRNPAQPDVRSILERHDHVPNRGP